MRIPNVKRHAQVFNIEDPEDREEYNKLISDPLITVLDRQVVKKTEESYQGEDGSRTDHMNILLEWEEKGL